MPIFTYQEIQEQKAVYKNALRICASGQSVKVKVGLDEKTLTLADLPEIRKTLTFLEAEELKLLGSRGPVRVEGRPAR